MGERNMERKKTIRYVAYLAVFSALTFVATVLITIPMVSLSGGYINFGDTIIFVASAILGPMGGLVGGALGSVIADLIYAPQYALITLIVKGLEGMLAGLTIQFVKKLSAQKKWSDYVAFVVGFIVGGLEMVLGYYIGGGILLGLLNEDMVYGFKLSLLDMPYNFIQFGVSVAVGYAISIGLIHIPYVRGIRDTFAVKKKIEKQENPDLV